MSSDVWIRIIRTNDMVNGRAAVKWLKFDKIRGSLIYRKGAPEPLDELRIVGMES